MRYTIQAEGENFVTTHGNPWDAWAYFCAYVIQDKAVTVSAHNRDGYTLEYSSFSTVTRAFDEAHARRCAFDDRSECRLSRHGSPLSMEDVTPCTLLPNGKVDGRWCPPILDKQTGEELAPAIPNEGFGLARLSKARQGRFKTVGKPWLQERGFNHNVT
jgi:hypothetical protein